MQKTCKRFFLIFFFLVCVSKRISLLLLTLQPQLMKEFMAEAGVGDVRAGLVGVKGDGGPPLDNGGGRGGDGGFGFEGVGGGGKVFLSF